MSNSKNHEHTETYSSQRRDRIRLASALEIPDCDCKTERLSCFSASRPFGCADREKTGDCDCPFALSSEPCSHMIEHAKMIERIGLTDEQFLEIMIASNPKAYRERKKFPHKISQHLSRSERVDLMMVLMHKGFSPFFDVDGDNLPGVCSRSKRLKNGLKVQGEFLKG